MPLYSRSLCMAWRANTLLIELPIASLCWSSWVFTYDIGGLFRIAIEYFSSISMQLYLSMCLGSVQMRLSDALEVFQALKDLCEILLWVLEHCSFLATLAT